MGGGAVQRGSVPERRSERGAEEEEVGVCVEAPDPSKTKRRAYYHVTPSGSRYGRKQGGSRPGSSAEPHHPTSAASSASLEKNLFGSTHWPGVSGKKKKTGSGPSPPPIDLGQDCTPHPRPSSSNSPPGSHLKEEAAAIMNLAEAAQARLQDHTPHSGPNGRRSAPAFSPFTNKAPSRRLLSHEPHVSGVKARDAALHRRFPEGKDPARWQVEKDREWVARTQRISDTRIYHSEAILAGKLSSGGGSGRGTIGISKFVGPSSWGEAPFRPVTIQKEPVTNSVTDARKAKTRHTVEGGHGTKGIVNY